jgi:MoxR-like ATPase
MINTSDNIKNVPKNMLRRDDVIWWMNRLEQVDHYIEPETALTIANWWDDSQGPLILEGPPGGGKTSLAKKIAELMGASFYRLQCYKSIGKTEALYDWDKNIQRVLVQEAAKNNLLGSDINKIIYQNNAMVLGVLAQSLMDEDDIEDQYRDVVEPRRVVVLIDELDKIPSEDAFEGLLLEFLEEAAITVPELNTRISPRSGKRPHVVITSNAGKGGLKESLSHPILRRGRYVYLPEPEPGRQFCILEQCAPNLAKEVIRDVVAFTYWAKKLVRFEKPIALSEVIMWARTLEMCKVKHLDRSVVEATIAELAKRDRDKTVLLTATDRLLKIIYKAYYQDQNVVQFPSINNQNNQSASNQGNQGNQGNRNITSELSNQGSSKRLVKLR